MTDPTIASWSRESDLLFQLRQLREENERLKKEIANQRPWQGLTEIEATVLWENTHNDDSWEFMKRVEAALRSKNT